MDIRQIQMRYGTHAEWTTDNAVLIIGEIGVDTTPGAIKTGDGATAFLSLPYAGTPPTITDATTSRALAPTDAGTLIRFTSDSAIAVTIGLEASAAWPAGAEVLLVAAGAGQITITDGSGITVNKTNTLLSRAQGSLLALKRVAADEFDLFGDTADS
jgi:hypothetical protein